jgi:hypothetical protein
MVPTRRGKGKQREMNIDKKISWFRGNQKKTASRASDKSAVDLAFEEKRTELDLVQQSMDKCSEKQVEWTSKQRKAESKVAECKKALEEAERELEETKELRNQHNGVKVDMSMRLYRAEAQFVVAGVAYTKENMRKFGVVNDKDDEHSDKEDDNSECDHTDNDSTNSSVADPDTEAEPQRTERELRN